MAEPIKNLTAVIPTLSSSVLTIGSFDGVHLGHQLLLQTLRKASHPQDTCAILTFANHPSTLFRKEAPTPLITPLSQRLSLLSEYCPESLIVPLPFTQALANTPYDVFLTELHQKLHFHTLVLGKGATLGKERLGDEEKVKNLGAYLGFKVQYIEKKDSCSSRQIRTLIEQGDLSQASLLLGRPYSLWGTIEQDERSLYCAFPGICLPPSGVYDLKIVDCQNETECECEGTLENEKIRFEKGGTGNNIIIFFLSTGTDYTQVD